MDSLRENILSIYTATTNKEKYEARLWFPKARDWASSLSKRYGVSEVVSCGILSATSPIKSWNENKRIADAYFQGKFFHTKRQIDKCHRIRELDSYSHTINILGGLKTRNFFRNIFDPEDKYACTIDRHALSVAYKKKVYTCTDKQYMQVQKAYVDLAREVGVLPSVLQGACWIHYRKNKKKLNYQ